MQLSFPQQRQQPPHPHHSTHPPPRPLIKTPRHTTHNANGRPLPLNRSHRLRYVSTDTTPTPIHPSNDDTGAAPAATVEDSHDLLDGGGDSTDDFLSRERAALGDDADQFASPGDNAGDLLGGGGQTNGTSEEELQFRSSFPEVDGRNDVWSRLAPPAEQRAKGARSSLEMERGALTESNRL